MKLTPSNETRDKIHQVLELEDIVVFAIPRYRGIAVGIITKLYPKSADIKYSCGIAYKVHTSNVIKINEQMHVAKEQNPEFFI